MRGAFCDSRETEHKASPTTKLATTLAAAIAVIALLSAENAFTAAEPSVAKPIPVTQKNVVEESAYTDSRSLRSNPAREDEDADAQDEERVFNTGDLLNIFKPRTAEQIAEATKRADTVEFYSKLAKSLSFRRERFTSWGIDRIPVSTIENQLAAHGFQEKYKIIVTKYINYLKTGVIS
ncbi:hypothetical protein L916_19942 [Phytophthora nicotianae]|uniref:RxLR effector protein n=1 Tax=Phytophthora nicotianae TaxID=4792 RepID=W2HWL7_PHYNI|nr:hypothetical protein L916_19942 [Phytophthora nicotianae]